MIIPTIFAKCILEVAQALKIGLSISHSVAGLNVADPKALNFV